MKNLVIHNSSLFVLIFIVIIIPTQGLGQVNSLVFLEVTNTTGDEIEINDNNRGDNPFNKIRAKWFVNSWINEDFGAFMKLLYDGGIHNNYDDKIRIDGAYFLWRINDRLNYKAGRIQSTLGLFPDRYYFEKNNLIGVPLMYSYRLGLPRNEVISNDDLVANRGTNKGVNIIYEACWNEGFEIFGDFSSFEYKAAVTDGSLSNPTSRSNDGFQYMAQINFKYEPGLRVGVGYGYTSYLNDNAADYVQVEDTYGYGTADIKDEDYKSQIINAVFEYSANYFEVLSEFVNIWYHSGYDKKKIGLNSYYIEGKYKFSPRIYGAKSFDQVMFEEIELPNGSKETWDYNISRIEAGFGYKITRKSILKGILQLSKFENDIKADIGFVGFQIKTEL